MSRSIFTSFVCCLGAALCAGGCRASLRTYPSQPVEASLAIMAARYSQMTHLASAGTLTVHNPEEGSITLEVAIVARRPDQIRLRAWKLGRSVVDLTLAGDSVEGEIDRRIERPRIVEGLRALRTVLLAINDEFYANASEISGSDESTLFVEGIVADRGDAVRAEIHRPTLTLRSLTIGPDRTAESFTLDRYHLVEDTAWPMRIRAISGDLQAEFRFNWVELNGPMPRGAFPVQDEPDLAVEGGP